jgi:hypothetical protein
LSSFQHDHDTPVFCVVNLYFISCRLIRGMGDMIVLEAVQASRESGRDGPEEIPTDRSTMVWPFVSCRVQVVPLGSLSYSLSFIAFEYTFFPWSHSRLDPKILRCCDLQTFSRPASVSGFDFWELPPGPPRGIYACQVLPMMRVMTVSHTVKY